MPEPDPPELRHLAIKATRGSSNNIFQVATLVRAATALGARVDVLFSGDALGKLRLDRVNVSEWSRCYSSVEAELTGRLEAAEFVDMESFLRDAKQHGDDASFWACSDTLADAHYALEQLVDTLDGARSQADFERAANDADAVLSF
jgi:peroxiredoxin family protein